MRNIQAVSSRRFTDRLQHGKNRFKFGPVAPVIGHLFKIHLLPDINSKNQRPCPKERSKKTFTFFQCFNPVTDIFHITEQQAFTARVTKQLNQRYSFG